jgi:glucokinase
MLTQKIIGIDLGATNIRAGVVNGDFLEKVLAIKTKNQGTEQEVIEDLFGLIDALFIKDITAIGIGVPSVVDTQKGIVYDVQYIPSWKKVALKEILEKKYGIPVWVNNDANCFVLGEYYFGKAKGVKNLVGLTIGTGLGTGIIINHQLYEGENGGAGELGMVDYLDHYYEYYASGSFFKNVYGLNGEEVFAKAQQGDAESLSLYQELGKHLGNALKLVMYSYDPSYIVIGGSVKNAFPFFETTMRERLQSFVYGQSVKNLQIVISDVESSAILGAAGLYYNQQPSNK